MVHLVEEHDLVREGVVPTLEVVVAALPLELLRVAARVAIGALEDRIGPCAAGGGAWPGVGLGLGLGLGLG